MSVLDDINTQDGLTARLIAGGCWAGEAKNVMKCISSHRLHRMDGITYAQNLKDVPHTVRSKVNHYWIDGDKMKWGLPTGSLESHCLRLMEYSQDWDGEFWNPNKDRITSEQRSRDLLLASYLYPMRVKRKTAEYAHMHASLPILRAFHKSSLFHGSSAVYKLLEIVESKGDASASLKALSTKRNAGIPDDWWASFNNWMTGYSFATSANVNDVGKAVGKTSDLDHELFGKSKPYLALAELATICELAMKSANRRGKLGKAYTALNSKINKKRQELAELGGVLLEEDLKKAQNEALNQLRFGAQVHSKSVLFASGVSKGIRITATRDLAWVYMVSTKQIFAINSEDAKALRFIAMSHSSWWVYASTIKCEYHPQSDNKAETIEGQCINKAVAALKEVHAELNKRFQYGPGTIEQSTVSYNAIASAIADLWKLYRGIRTRALRARKQDYVGRYVHSIFEVYTSVLGGHLASEGYDEQVSDVKDDFACHGFSVTTDITRFTEIVADLPIGVTQDFGRLSKIVPPYDVNPMFSFLQRAQKMQEPNPIGMVEYTEGVEHTIREFTRDEDKLRESEFKSAATVLIAIADIKKSSLQQIDPEDKERIDRSSWVDIVNYLKQKRLDVRGNCVLLREPKYHVPQSRRAEARRQANDLIVRGKQPSEVLAGAYIETTAVLAYTERGHPDLAVIKPTAMPPDKLIYAFSNKSKLRRVGPTVDLDGLCPSVGGDMISDYLADRFPSRQEALEYCGHEISLAKVSDKVETNKYPLKTRVITSLSGAPRRVQGEFEHNNGKAMKDVPGFTVGADPASIRKSMYSAIRQNLQPGFARLFISLDLSSWSTGMHWDIQEWCNEVLDNAYDGGSDIMSVINDCTKGSGMFLSASGVRLYHQNKIGANYEGIDGKRNTFMHCVMWYIARAEAYKAGVLGAMRSLIFIDDGTANIEVPEEQLERTAIRLKRALFKAYTAYGFKLSIRKTVVSEVYAQFLNELYFHGVHIGYGFRALCHTASQSFPELATVPEELAVIVGGIRGAAYSGGHVLRLMVGYHYILNLYLLGVIGNKGHSIRSKSAAATATLMNIPTTMGGFGLPSFVQLFSNLAGNRDVEKMSKPKSILSVVKLIKPESAPYVKSYMIGKLMMPAVIKPDSAPDRITASHPATAEIGSKNRSKLIAEAALKVCRNPEAEAALNAFVSSAGEGGKGTFRHAFVTMVGSTKLPMALAEKAMDTDPDLAIADLVEKIASSRMISKLLSRSDISRMNRKYVKSARIRVKQYLYTVGSHW